MLAQKNLCRFRNGFIGLITIIIVVALVVLGGKSSNQNVSPTSNFYKAYFSSVDGLTTRTPIYLSGYKVGHVKNVGLNNNFRSYAWLVVDKKIPLPDDSSFSVKEDGFMGKKIIIINLGISDTYFCNNDTVTYTNSGMSMVKVLDLLIDYVGKLKKGSK